MTRPKWIFRGMFVIALLLYLGVPPAGAFLLPDSGQTTCYGDKGKGKLIVCPAPDVPLAQDGSYSIHPPSYRINGNGTVTDNNTFLIWQQNDDNQIRTWDAANTYCEDLELAGHNDWHLPSKDELASIIDYGRYNPAIDFNVFSNAKASAYWSSTLFPNYGAFVDFGKGIIDAQLKSAWANVRCVRGNMTFDDLKDNGNGTVTDMDTGLTWQQFTGGQMKWGYALEYCEGLSLDGNTDWRLPNIRELESFKTNSALHGMNSSGVYWSSTTSAAETESAWTSYTLNLKRERNNYVRCVRGEKKSPLDYSEIFLEPSALDFGYVGVNEIKQLTLNVSNIGTAALVIGAPALPLAPFSVTGDNCSGKTVSGWDTCSITLAFTTTSPGTYTDKITIFSNDTDHPAFTVDLWATVTLLSGGEYFLPDSGQTYCFSGNDGYIIGCPPSGSPLAQDGSYAINRMSFTNNGDSTITDNNTFLMWQLDDDNIRRSADDAKVYCDSLFLGGHTGWRLPTTKELITITDYNLPFGALSPSGFPNADNKKFMATENANNPGLFYTKCVRGGVLPSDPLTDNGDGTTTDYATGLVWQQNITSAQTDWVTGLGYCEGLSLGGHADWRLPNVKELVSLSDYSLYDPIKDFQSFYPNDIYWSSTTQLNTPLSYYDEAYRVNTTTGGVDGSTCCKSFRNLGRVRCVRGGNVFESFPGLTVLITSPINNTLLYSPTLIVTGTVTNEASVTVNGAPASISGKIFSAQIALTEGENTITAEAVDIYGQTASQSITVTLSTAGSISGRVTDPSTGLLISQSVVSVTDSSGYVRTASTWTDGTYIFTDVPSGDFSVTITKDGYIPYGSSGTAFAGQTTVVNATLSPILLIINNVASTNIAVDSATISWTTDQPSDSRVDYGETATYGYAISNAELVTSHSIALNNLSPGAIYHFKVTSQNAYGISSSSGDYTFTTSAPPPAISNIAAINITTDSATITWTTDQPTSSVFEYGTTAAYGSSIADSALTTSHSIEVPDMISGTLYHFRITATNAYGTSSTSEDNSFTASNPIAVTITSPANNASINRPDFMVKGTLTNSTGNETGVVVNGMPATLYGNQFIVNHVPLTDGATTITVTATDTEGNTISKSVSVNAVTTGNYIRLISNIESGIAPFQATLRIDGSFSITASDISISGPGSVQLLPGDLVDQYDVVMTTEGVYYFTVSVTGPDNVVYEDTVAITVLNKTQLDTLLKAKWEGMKGALANRDIVTASGYFTEESRQIYHDIFTSLSAYLPQIVQEFQPIQLIQVNENTAEYRIRRDELYGGRMVTMTYYIYFAIEKNGLWKIYRY